MRESVDYLFGEDNASLLNSVNSEFINYFIKDYSVVLFHRLRDDAMVLRFFRPELFLNENEPVEFNEINDAIEALKDVIYTYVHPEDRSKLLEIFNPEHNSEVLEHQQSYDLLYRRRNKNSGYIYNKIVISKTEAADEPAKNIMIGCIDINDEMNTRLNKQKTFDKYVSLAAAFASKFQFIFHVDLDTGEVERYDFMLSTGSTENATLIKENYEDAIGRIIDLTIDERERELIRTALDIEYIKWKLRRDDEYVKEYRNLDDRYCEVRCHRVIRQDNRNMAIVSFAERDQEIRAKKTMSKTNSFQRSIMDGLSREYHNVWLIHPDRSMEIFRNDGQNPVLSAIQLGLDTKDYALTLPLYVERYVVEEDRERVLNEAKMYNLLNSIPENGTFTITYRRADDEGNITYNQACYAKAVTDEGVVNVVVGFRNVDAQMKKELRRKEQLKNAVLERDSDGLTKLNNRLCYERKLLGYSQKTEGTITCIYIDVNGLHELNNTKGHEAGDVMLKLTAHTIQKIWGTDDTFRIGGDEFVVFLFNIEEDIVKSEILQFNTTLEKYGYRASVGYALDGVEGLVMTEFIKLAESRMYDQKRAHYSGVRDRRRRSTD